jgi:hypothetical protein
LSKAFHSPIFVLPRILNGGLCMYWVAMSCSLEFFSQEF